MGFQQWSFYGLRAQHSCGREQRGLRCREAQGFHEGWKSPHVTAAAAKSLQSCPTLCNRIDGSPPGSSVPGDSPGKNTGVGCHFLLQCMKVKVKWLSHVGLVYSSPIPIFNQVVFLLLSCKQSLYILDRILLSDTGFANIFWVAIPWASLSLC